MRELIASPGNPIPEGAAVYILKTRDGRRLRAAAFPCSGSARGTVALFQGHNEFIEKYFETIEELRSRRLDVVALDWRGQAGSERELADPRKGHIDDFSQYQRDLEVFISQVLSERPQPWFALAHSMGAAILLDAAHAGKTPFQRFVLTAPMIDLANLRFPRGSRWLADTLDMCGLGGKYIPGGTGASFIEKPFKGNLLTTDPVRFERNAAILRVAPQLAIGDPTIGWVNAAFRLMRGFESPDYARRIRATVLMFGCGREMIVSNAAIERFAQNLDSGVLAMVPGAKHELMMERDEFRSQFWRGFDAFIPGEARVS